MEKLYLITQILTSLAFLSLFFLVPLYLMYLHYSRIEQLDFENFELRRSLSDHNRIFMASDRARLSLKETFPSFTPEAVEKSKKFALIFMTFFFLSFTSKALLQKYLGKDARSSFKSVSKEVSRECR